MRDVDAVLDFWEGLLNGGGEVEIARARMDANDVRALCAEIRKVREERDEARELFLDADGRHNTWEDWEASNAKHDG